MLPPRNLQGSNPFATGSEQGQTHIRQDNKPNTLPTELLGPRLQAVSAVMAWSVHVQKVPQASQHFCVAMLQTRSYVCSACLSVCLFIPSCSGMARTADPHRSKKTRQKSVCVTSNINSILTINRKFSDMIGTLLYVSGS